ncbi:hypothetical protein GGTG_05754 [Gaeumannomyces tritici R3-111a-1]|uniref:Uncharacterized protein n=1 Tax=Gaeumannomyces tritici (strain R3-111a-1) TaxID=644352 RepID=J3NWU3_GAET3|nr:hypothetical protein GGTG_05754 [Gaeumannomyces tritici R3-111a-1]EJT75825.1 hypothetical protein GGTG_05754 [Gaeumannomyces tritici R3-111a-1]
MGRSAGSMTSQAEPADSSGKADSSRQGRAEESRQSINARRRRSSSRAPMGPWGLAGQLVAASGSPLAAVCAGWLPIAVSPAPILILRAPANFLGHPGRVSTLRSHTLLPSHAAPSARDRANGRATAPQIVPLRLYPSVAPLISALVWSAGPPSHSCAATNGRFVACDQSLAQAIPRTVAASSIGEHFAESASTHGPHHRLGPMKTLRRSHGDPDTPLLASAGHIARCGNPRPPSGCSIGGALPTRGRVPPPSHFHPSCAQLGSRPVLPAVAGPPKGVPVRGEIGPLPCGEVRRGRPWLSSATAARGEVNIPSSADWSLASSFAATTWACRASAGDVASHPHPTQSEDLRLCRSRLQETSALRILRLQLTRWGFAALLPLKCILPLPG